MARKIKISADATEQMNRVMSRLRLQGQDKLHTLRIAFARSIQTGQTVDPGSPTVRNGFEIEVPTFEQREGVLFGSILRQKYRQSLDEGLYDAYLLRHIEHGLNVLDQDTASGLNGYEYLAKIAQKGMQDAGIKADTASSDGIPIVSGFADVLNLRIGLNKSDNQPYTINFNKFDEHPNSHIGVVGTTGSGKTYFIKYLLTKLREASNFETNFIFFDYKGDVFGDDAFVRGARAEVLRVMERPIPINIFRGQEKRANSERIVEIIRSVEANIGRVQEQNLYTAIVDAYDAVERTSTPFPDFQMVKDRLDDITPRPDSLTSVFRPLTEHNLFARRDASLWDSIIDRTIIVDIHDLPACKELCVFLMLNETYRQLKAMGNSRENAETKTREMRTVIVIDEAHHFLKNRKRVSILESIIREVRSMGAAVILLSQSPEDFDQSDFNFMELLEFVYVLNCTPDSNKFLKQYFGLSNERANSLLRDVTGLKTGEAITRGLGKEIIRLDLCK